MPFKQQRENQSAYDMAKLLCYQKQHQTASEENSMAAYRRYGSMAKQHGYTGSSAHERALLFLQPYCRRNNSDDNHGNSISKNNNQHQK